MKTILLVEDNPDDVVIIRNACQRSGFPHLLNVVTDGEAAVDYLRGGGGYTDRRTHPFPDLILLDLKLPKKTGHEVVEWIRAQSAMRSMPVLMLTNSDMPSDINRAYNLGVTSYLTKQGNIAEFAQAIRIILKYWFELNIPPY